jgi:tartrate dehydrogenase/decarboxylase/D-malate dehydrogenase
MSYRVALIPGDGIGREVVPEGVRALKTLSDRFKFAMEFAEFPYSCEHYPRCRTTCLCGAC